MGIGSEVDLAGSLRPAKPPDEGEFDLAAYLRRRGVAGELDAERAEVTGRRRGGVAGMIDGVRRRAEMGIASGLTAGSEALARGMVLGQDEAIDPLVRDDFRASGLAHVLTYQHQDRRRVCEPSAFGWSHSTVSGAKSEPNSRATHAELSEADRGPGARRRAMSAVPRSRSRLRRRRAARIPATE
jgi:hypothetical protein